MLEDNLVKEIDDTLWRFWLEEDDHGIHLWAKKKNDIERRRLMTINEEALVNWEDFDIIPISEEVPLTKREMEVLLCIAHGKSNKEIARSLNIARNTVKTHISSIYGKLGINGRTQAVIYAYRRGWVN